MVRLSCLVLMASLAPALLMHAGSSDTTPSRAVGADDCCRMLVDTLVSFDTRDGPLSLTSAFSVAKSAGRYAFAPQLYFPHVAIYDDSGRFEMAYVQRGQGPGELNDLPVSVHVGAADSLLVAQGNRIIAFDQDLEPARTIVLPLAPYVVRGLGDGSLVVNAPRGAGGETRLVHRFSSDGDLKSSSVGVRSLLGGPNDLLRLLAIGSDVSGGHGFWSFERGSNLLIRHGDDGGALGELLLQRPWFSEWRSPEDAADPAKPRMMAVTELEGGHLLVLTRMPRPGWEPHADQVIRPDDDPSDAAYSRIELVDVATGRVLDQLDHDRLVWPIEGAPDEFAVADMTDPMGFVRITILRVRVE